MVFMRMTTTKTLTLKQENEIHESVQKLLSEEDIMLHIEDNQVMYHTSSDDCMYIECQIFEDKDINEFINLLKSEIESITNVSIQNQKMSVSIVHF